jgi:soluble lytic murein transglycosylase-like protein
VPTSGFRRRSPVTRRGVVLSTPARGAFALVLLFAASALAAGAQAAGTDGIILEPVVVRLDEQERNRRALIESAAREHGIARDLAVEIHQIALEEGVPPEVAFGLVWVESRYDERAVSSAGARGLTQLMPATALYLEPELDPESLFDRRTNLRLGFRYLRMMLDRYDDLELALTAYNRGPGTVQRHLAMGIDPANGFDRLVLDAKPAPRASR